MHLDINLATFHRLPRHPDWRYEYWDGAAHLSHRPRWLRFRRLTAAPATDSAPVDVAFATTDRDRAAELMLSVWSVQDPYVTHMDPELLKRQVTHALGTAQIVALACVDEKIAGAATVAPDWHTGEPCMAWLTVDPRVRERGIATALLRAISQELNSNGAETLWSSASAANIPSLRWHLTRGFELASDPLREATRDGRAASSRRSTGITSSAAGDHEPPQEKSSV